MGIYENLIEDRLHREAKQASETRTRAAEEEARQQEEQLLQQAQLVESILSEVGRLAALLSTEDWHQRGQLYEFPVVDKPQRREFLRARRRTELTTARYGAITIFRPKSSEEFADGYYCIYRSDDTLFMLVRTKRHPSGPIALRRMLEILPKSDLQKIEAALVKVLRASDIPVSIDIVKEPSQYHSFQPNKTAPVHKPGAFHVSYK